MTAQVNVETTLNMREKKGLSGILGKRQDSRSLPPVGLAGLWGPGSYGLEESEFFRNLNEEIQNQCLEDLAYSRLEEAIHIEKAGMAYSAKMSLLSDTLEERRMYSHFACDEARHLGYLEKVLPLDTLRERENPFLDLLDQMITDGRRRPLIFIIQVLLEGWGIEHYQTLSSDCRIGPFRELLEKIVRDEAGHHGSGLVLFDEKELTAEEKEEVREALIRFFQFVRIGPAGLLQSLVKASGGLSRDEAKRFLAEIRAEEMTQNKLTTLKRMMKKSSAAESIEFIEKRGADKSLSQKEMLDVLY